MQFQARLSLLLLHAPMIIGIISHSMVRLQSFGSVCTICAVEVFR